MVALTATLRCHAPGSCVASPAAPFAALPPCLLPRVAGWASLRAHRLSAGVPAPAGSTQRWRDVAACRTAAAQAPHLLSTADVIAAMLFAQAIVLCQPLRHSCARGRLDPPLDNVPTRPRVLTCCTDHGQSCCTNMPDTSCGLARRPVGKLTLAWAGWGQLLPPPGRRTLTPQLQQERQDRPSSRKATLRLLPRPPPCGWWRGQHLQAMRWVHRCYA